MSIKISELPQATSVGSSDIVPIVQGGTTKQVTADDVVQQREDLSNTITYTAMSGVTIDTFVAYKINNILYLQVSFTVASNSNRVIELLTLTNISDVLFSVMGYGRTWASSASTTVTPCSGLLSAGSKKIIVYQTVASAVGGVVQLSLPMPTISSTRSLNLTKSENTGSLVGLGDKAEVTDETLEKTKLDEVAEVEENNESGDLK